jgi:hypothetical protein
LANARLCRDDANLYIRIDYRNGKPVGIRSMSRFVIVKQGEFELHLKVYTGGDLIFRPMSYDPARNVSTEIGAYAIGSDFLELRFPLSYLGKSFLNPKGLDFTRPISIGIGTACEDKSKEDWMGWLDLYFGP